MAGGLTVRSARQTYGITAAVVAGLLAVGLLVPLLFGESGPMTAPVGGAGSGSDGGAAVSTTAPTGPVPTTAVVPTTGSVPTTAPVAPAGTGSSG